MARVLKPLVVAGFLGMAGSDAVHMCIVATQRPDLTRALAAGYACLFAALICTFGLAVVRRPAARAMGTQPLAVVACTVALASVVALGRPTGGSATLAVAGESLAVFSCAWLVAAAVALGNCFGILPAARGLVTRGPYRLVRHPLYLGELGLYSGLLIASPRVLAGLGGIVFFAAQRIRLGLEEQVLAREFAVEYRVYAASTPQLVPRFTRWPRPSVTPSLPAASTPPRGFPRAAS